MPNFALQNQPKYPLISIDLDSPISEAQIIHSLGTADGMTLCIRSEEGHQKRGGYFFCISKCANDRFSLETIEGVYIDSFPLETLTKLINHASGRVFNKEMLAYCQNTINFKVD